MPFSLLSRVFVVVLFLAAPNLVTLDAANSQWVYPDAKGKLVYKTLERGDKIMDFSYAGYKGGGVALPEVEVRVTVDPLTGDNTESIQAAIDQVSKLPQVNGWRGAVLLRPGVYACERPLVINASGVVLRGSGSGEKGSVLKMTGTPHLCIAIGGKLVVRATGNATTIADAYVPSGAQELRVMDAKGLSAGDTIQLVRPVTPAWVAFMGMDQLTRDGKKQTWVTGDITAQHVIQRINGSRLILDVPLSDSYDANYTAPSGTKVQKVNITGELSNIGVEKLRIQADPQSVTINDAHHRALNMNGVTDGWVRDLQILNTVNSISIGSRRVTIERVNIVHDVPTIGAAKPADLNGSGSQLLFDRCTITGDNVFYFATGAKGTGPVVLLNCIFKGNGWIQPHQRWSTGLLVDGCQVPGGGIDFMNRGEMGSGHGWAIGWAVAWNCQAKSYLNQQPPGSANWVIGCQGDHQQRAMPFESAPLLPEGYYDSPGVFVTPRSLYLAQLSERLGKSAARTPA